MSEERERSRFQPRRSRIARWVRAVRPVEASALQADASVSAAPATLPVVIPATSVLAGQILRDGEVVVFMIKPSLFFVILSSLGWLGALTIATISASIADAHHSHVYVEAATFAAAARLTWAMLVWMGRLYVLTDQRVLRVSGVFAMELFECPLRKVARTRQVPTFRERLLRLGSIEIIPEDDARPCAVWQTVARPAQVSERLQRAIRRAKQGGCQW